MDRILHALIGDLSELPANAVKASTLFITAAVLLRIAERRALAGFAPIDWIAAAAAGAIIGRAATATDTSWLSASIALASLLMTHAAIARLRFIPGLRRVIDPPPRILIRAGKICHRNVRRCGLTSADLQALLRQHGHRNPDRVQLALFEAKGVVSVLSADGGLAPEHCAVSPAAVEELRQTAAER
jgi:uncharacterized membrane protein YcaP (DUF421 family)